MAASRATSIPDGAPVLDDAPRPRTTPAVQLVWDASQFARALARTYERRVRPQKRGPLHRV
jgi:hypothetical protein